MKKYLFSGILLGVLLVVTSAPAFALSTLQLDIGGGYYDDTTETIVTDSLEFTLYALLNGSDLLQNTFYISAAVQPIVEDAADLGSFTFDGNVINVTGDMTFGLPPLVLDPIVEWTLPPHGVYETYFSEIDFTFDSANKVGAYNTQDNTGQFDDFFPAAGGEPFLYYNAFSVNTSGLDLGYSIHFDLYTDDDGQKVFAPFSHDAESTPVVPEPGTMLMLGIGLTGLAGINRKKLFKK